MEYKIGEVSNILNIPVETLRYYEKKHIVQPKKSIKNRYRYYDAWEINYLIECKKFRSYDFSLPEVKEILHHNNLNDFIDKIDERQNYFEEQLNYYKLLKQKNEEYIQSLKQIKRNLWKCTLTPHPEIYYFIHRYNYTYKTKNEFGDLIDRWLEFFPFVENLIEIQDNALLNRNNTNDHGWGFSIKKEYADALKIPLNEKVKHVARSESIYTIICAGDKGSFSLKLLDHALTFIKEHDYKLSGTVTGNLLARVHEQNGYNRYIEVWLPVTKSS
ncbi:MerR family transcriptional regulator [Bacillus sp. B15-48]|uniref:MerR family transcriptional regulator n=1 Tax=Bacillus sp. B15-48 TaxID=1548601 RepID=UPI00193FC297|nr:MerR family transcriptional regulator [Bacillus sp. B15-48]MBM4761094.1 MerR family transcriptional regulator [Bacillus sp. B15-48]